MQRLLVLRRPRLTVLLYHSISNTDNFFAVPPDTFQKQIEYVRRHYTIVGAPEVAAFLRGEVLQKDSVMITFDDGYQDAAEIAGPILKRLGAVSTVFVMAGEPDRTELGNTIPIMSITDVTRLNTFGITVGSHGCTHKKLTRMSEEDARHELEESRARIAEYAVTPEAFAYPKGAYNAHAKKLVRDAGYTLAYTTEARAVRHGDDPYSVPRVQIDATTDFAMFKAKLSPAQDWYYILWSFIMKRRNRTV